jgi:glycosyltransferase involved in cell wall biosynthesis
VVRSDTEEESAAVFAGADVFVLPSLFEGTPLTLIEAMMSGLPIVTTDTCGMRDVIAHERTGLLVAPRSPGALRDALERLLGDRTLRARLGQAAREEARARYTWPAAAQVVRHAYETLVGPA